MMHALALILLFAVDDVDELRRFKFAEPHMGTQFQIVLYAADEATANKSATAAFQRVAALDRVMSDYKPDSELMQLCRNAGGDPVPVSEELFHVLSHAQAIAKLSNGAFDVTVGPVSRLWRRSRKLHQLPANDELSNALKLVGYKEMVLDVDFRTVRLTKIGMMLDLGGIGKGYAADEAMSVLENHGVKSALIAAGGDCVVSGPPPNSPPHLEGWFVAVASPDDRIGRPNRAVRLQHAAVSTSGDAFQFLEIGGNRHSHLIDPRTGLGLTERISVTVVAPRGIDADPLTKVVSVLGPDQGFKVIDSIRGAGALLIRKSDLGIEEAMSAEFRKLPAEFGHR